ncbi:hypothetical protein D1BOALGB6SA_212, partial [Olavius sp. associated proteobacterium Delta 1]
RIQKPESRISQYFQWSSLQQLSWISKFYATIGYIHCARQGKKIDRALEIGGINAATPNPPGGENLNHAASGKPSGILLNEAQALGFKTHTGNDAGPM